MVEHPTPFAQRQKSRFWIWFRVIGIVVVLIFAASITVGAIELQREWGDLPIYGEHIEVPLNSPLGANNAFTGVPTVRYAKLATDAPVVRTARQQSYLLFDSVDKAETWFKEQMIQRQWVFVGSQQESVQDPRHLLFASDNGNCVQDAKVVDFVFEVSPYWHDGTMQITSYIFKGCEPLMVVD